MASVSLPAANLAFLRDGRYLNSEDSEFFETVAAEVEEFLKKSSVTRVLLFPPVNSYHRFLIHNVVEGFPQVKSFSVGEGSARQTVVCLKDALYRGPKGIELMSSAESWTSRCGRGRGRARNKEHQSAVGHDSRHIGAGDSLAFSSVKHMTTNDITDSRIGTGRTGHTLSGICDQESTKLDGADSNKKKKALSSRTKTKKPEIQVYVPRARRVQQQLHDSMDSRSGQDDLAASHSSQQDIAEQKVESPIDKPVSSRRKHRPEMQRYVPRGKREINTVVQDNSGSALNSESESRTVRTDKLSSRMEHVKKIKIGENGEEFSNVNQIGEQWDEDLTGRFDSDERGSDAGRSSTFTHTSSHEERPMEVHEQDMVYCSDSNISKDSLFSTSVDTSLNTSNFYSMSECSATEQSMTSDAVCELSETSHISLELANQSDSGICYVSDSASSTNSPHSTCDLIAVSTDTSARKSSDELQCSNKDSKAVEFPGKYSKEIKYSSRNLSFNSQHMPDDDNLHMDPGFSSNQELAHSEEKASLVLSSSDTNISLNCHGDESKDSKGTTVDLSPDICYVEASKHLNSTEIRAEDKDLSSVMSQESGPSNDEASLDVLPDSSLPGKGDTSDVSDQMATTAASSSMNCDRPGVSSWTLSTAGAAGGPSKSGTEVHQSSSLPDVVASTIELKRDHVHDSAESKSDTTVELDKSDRDHLTGGLLTSIALKQLDSVTDLKAPSGEEAMNSKTDSKSEDEDGWDALFDDNGDCLDPSIMEELTAHVGNVQIDKPKINYLKFETKDPDLDMEAYNHVIEIYDFPSEFKTGDLIAVFKDFMTKGFDIKWVDDTHALGVFENKIAARDALSTISPLLKVRPMSEASKQSKLKAKKTAEFLQPYKARPQTSAVAARRLVSGALGIQASIPREKRELERKQLKEAKEKRKQAKQQKQDIWDGSFGKCAMDEDV